MSLESNCLWLSSNQTVFTGLIHFSCNHILFILLQVISSNGSCQTISGISASHDCIGKYMVTGNCIPVSSFVKLAVYDDIRTIFNQLLFLLAFRPMRMMLLAGIVKDKEGPVFST